MRTLILSLRNAWLGHLVLAGACVWALRVHATYRVPAGPLLLVLPWLGVAAAATSVLMLIVSLLPRGDGGTVARLLDRLDRRSVLLAVLLIPTTFAASACTTTPWLALLYLGLGASVSAASLAAITRRMITDGGPGLAEGLRWLERAALAAVGAFLCWSVVVFANGALDSSRPIEQDSEVLAVVVAAVDTGFGTLVPHTQADVRSWRSRSGVERIVLAPREIHHVWVGQPIHVRVHAGRLGIPWISSVALDELRHARQILAASPTALHALKKLTKGLLDRGQLDEALAVTRRYAQLYPDDTGHVHFVAGYFGIAGRYRDQAELMEAAVARRPDYGSLCMLGNAMAKGGSPHRAIEVLNRATQMNPGSFVAFHYLGEIYDALGRYQEAIAAYEAELVVRPRSRETQQRIDNIRKAMSARATARQ